MDEHFESPWLFLRVLAPCAPRLIGTLRMQPARVPAQFGADPPGESRREMPKTPGAGTNF